MRLLAGILLVVAACGSTTPSAPTGTPVLAPPTASESSSAPQVSDDGALATQTPDPETVAAFTAALARFFAGQAPVLADSSGVDAVADWPAAQAVFVRAADVYGAFHRDLREIPFPNPEEVGSHSTALIGWAQELEALMRNTAASTSWMAAQESVVEFEGATYQYLAFLQDATGEFYAAMDLTAGDLGVELPKSSAAPSSAP